MSQTAGGCGDGAVGAGLRAARRLTRVAASLGALLLLLLACSPGNDVVGEEPGVVVDDGGGGGREDEAATPGSGTADGEAPPDDPEPAGREQQGTPEAPPQPAGGEPEGGEPEPQAPPEPESVSAVPDDRGPLGSACRAYLRGDVPGLAVEVLEQSGAELRTEAVDHLVTTLGEVLDKPAGIDLVGPRRVPGGERTWSLQQVRDLLVEHRVEYSNEDRMVMAILAVAGDFERDGVLGVALSATEVVLFPDEISDLGTSLLGDGAPIERAVLVHEAGHLLCLVNATYESSIDHEDPERPGHSRHRDSVMYWAVSNDAVSQVFTGPPPDAFHPHDLADLEGLRDGRY